MSTVATPVAHFRLTSTKVLGIVVKIAVALTVHVQLAVGQKSGRKIALYYVSAATALAAAATDSSAASTAVMTIQILYASFDATRTARHHIAVVVVVWAVSNDSFAHF